MITYKVMNFSEKLRKEISSCPVVIESVLMDPRVHYRHPQTRITPRLLYRTRRNDAWVETVWRNFDVMCQHYGYAPIQVACLRMSDILQLKDAEYYYDEYGLHLEGRFSHQQLDHAFHHM